MPIRRLVLLVAVLLLAPAGCGGRSGAAPSGARSQGTSTASPVQPCPDHRGLRVSVAGISCTEGGAVADAMGPTSSRATFSVRGFRCERPPSGAVRCTRGGAVLVLSGGD